MSGQMRTVGAVSAVPTIVVLLAVGFALRLIIAYVLLPHSGFPSDLGTFQAWGNDIGASGPLGFYDKPTFHDYPPVYLYILGILGFFTQPGMGMLVKLPPMLFDLALAALVWKMAEEFGAARWLALVTAAVVLVNPVTWFNSAVWGQADSVGTVILLLGLRELMKDHREASAALAVTAILTKPQLGILAILVGVVIIRRSLWPAHGRPEPRRIVTSALAGAFVGAAICLPIVGLHLDSLAQEWASPAGKLEAVGALLVAVATFFIVLTSRNEWLTGGAGAAARGSGEAAAPRDPDAVREGAPEPEPGRMSLRPRDRWHAATAVVLALFGGILFAGIRFDVIVGQMIQTFGEYSYLTVNAYNPWALVTQNGGGMVTTLTWIHDAPYKDGNVIGTDYFTVGPFATAVAIPVFVLFVGLVAAVIARTFGSFERSRAVAAGCLVLAALLGIVLALGNGLFPGTVSVPAAVVGEVALLAVFTLTAAWAAWRDDDAALVVGLAVLAIAFFVVPTRAHERYLFPFFGVGAILFAVSARWRGLYLGLIVANVANLLAVLTYPLYNGIPVPKDAVGGYTLDRILNDWGGWIRGWRLDSQDPQSWVVPVAAVSVAMGLGFLWAFAQLRPAAADALERERASAGWDPRFDYDADGGAAPEPPAEPRPKARDAGLPQQRLIRKTGTRRRAIPESNRDA